MKKKLLSFILAFLLCVSLIPAALADSDKSIVYDREGLFDEFDTEIISGKLAELNRIYGVDVAVVTASSLDGKTAERLCHRCNCRHPAHRQTGTGRSRLQS